MTSYQTFQAGQTMLTAYLYRENFFQPDISQSFSTPQRYESPPYLSPQGPPSLLSCVPCPLRSCCLEVPVDRALLALPSVRCHQNHLSARRNQGHLQRETIPELAPRKRTDTTFIPLDNITNYERCHTNSQKDWQQKGQTDTVARY